MKLPKTSESCDKKLRIVLFVIIIELFVEKELINKQTLIHQEQNNLEMVLLITSPICQTKDYQDYKNVAKLYLSTTKCTTDVRSGESKYDKINKYFSTDLCYKCNICMIRIILSI